MSTAQNYKILQAGESPRGRSAKEIIEDIIITNNRRRKVGELHWIRTCDYSQKCNNEPRLIAQYSFITGKQRRRAVRQKRICIPCALKFAKKNKINVPQFDYEGNPIESIKREGN